jgi:osmotically-inducible protein OsmY
MRRFFMGMAIASLTVASPIAAQAGDREIADTIVQTLKSRQSDGSLKDFDIDLAVDAGVVTLSGSVANPSQATAVVEASRNTPGVIEIINEITIKDKATAKDASYVKQASGEVPVQGAGEPAAIQAVAPSVTPNDAKITDGILASLGSFKSDGTLRNFELDVSTVRGEVWARGYVATQEQKNLVLQTIQHAKGVTKVVDDINVTSVPGSNGVVKASDSQLMSTTSMPVTGQAGVPRAFAQSSLTGYNAGVPCATGEYAGGGYVGGESAGGPVPMSAGPSYGAGVPRYDNPQMPNYAWPSYAAHPNYAAVTYPKQYSASAWPYIGPFYPYPQVPLGWRKVALEWDDGLWYLDFSHKSGHR